MSLSNYVGRPNRGSNSLFPTLQDMGCSRPSVGFAREIRGGKSSETEVDRNPQFSVIESAAKEGGGAQFARLTPAR